MENVNVVGSNIPKNVANEPTQQSKEVGVKESKTNTKTDNLVNKPLDIEVSEKVSETYSPELLIESREVTIFRAPSKSDYVKYNRKNIGEIKTPLTPTRKATSKLLVASDLNKSVLSNIIGVSHRDNNWNNTIQNYYNSIFVLIPEGGKVLDTSFEYFSLDIKKKFDKQAENIEKLYLQSLSKSGENNYAVYQNYIDNLFALEVSKNKYNDSTMSPEYGRPLNPSDYIIWLYCLYSSIVANQVEFIDNSPNIRFYLSDEAEEKKRRAITYELRMKALSTLVTVQSNPDLVDTYLYMYSQLDPTLNINFAKLDTIDKATLLDKLCNEDYAKFNLISSDKHMELKATIEKLIISGILNRIPNTSVIVNSEDPTDVIGNNINDAVSYFSNNLNKPKVSKFIAKYNSLTTNMK